MKSGYKYKFQGVNVERFLNEMSKEFELFDVKKTGKNIQFCTHIFSDKKFCKKLKNYDIQIQQKKGFGPLYHMVCFFKRYGIIFALALALVFFVIESNFVFGIKIVGTKNISNQKIVDILKQNGFENINKKNNIDTNKFEKILTNNLEDISLVSIIVKGSTLVVSVKEKVQNSEYENLENFQPILSDYDGVVTSVKLVQGTLNKMVGDVVKKGDVLVFPYIVDSSGNKRQVEPKAEIFAKVYFTQNTSFYDVEIISERTGNKVVEKNIYAFGLKIFGSNTQCDFVAYDLETKRTVVSDNNMFPIILEQKIFYEVQTEQVNVDFEQKKQQVLADLKQKTLENLEDCDIIENERLNISSVAGKNNVEYILEVQKRIS